MSPVAFGGFARDLVADPEWRYFDGHFPGRPILPGVAQLDLLEREVARHGVALAGVDAVRLRQLVLPGDALSLAAAPADDGRSRFEIRRGADLVSHGVLVVADPGALPALAIDGWTGPAQLPADTALPPPPRLLPHQPPARLIDGVVRFDGTGLVARGRVPADSPFARERGAPALLGLEIAAQAAAAWEVLVRTKAGGDAAPGVGYVVAIRRASFARHTLPVDVPLAVVIRMTSNLLPLSHYDVTVGTDDGPVVTGSIATFLAT